MKRLLATIMLCCAASTHAEQPSLVDSMTAPWNTLVFVSTRMPQASVIELAREASQAGAVIVLTGFSDENGTLTATQKYAAQISSACCGKKPAHWIIDPVLTRRYHVTAAPTFVVAHGESDDPREYSKVAGEISLAQALKFVAQTSKLPAARDAASRVYYSAYGDKY
ncbi:MULTISPECIES: TrbC family F-type conjugative pilus assembly protein [Caballeronia]|uniref:Type VI secretion protein n=1 Tax=Caballeronia zhejiangensis TaxID=871203 RepID=A0A656Q9W4_9BURK|nr:MULTISPECIES: TrbC family F-type conjugative pilus assembly protein [Caballeronia]KDR25592.1 type VI secretion protein [Caballeronia zhejiangensis]MCE4547998.1 type-F conjugative transfer system pilin assembly protein TrbC [Caballeronia sp. PC1]MCE4575711.1 type-F conjugative transfer system pilin assembly protein TrbC [Caballeronia sp. CLC5]